MGLKEDVELEWLERERRIARYCAERMAEEEASAFEVEMLGDYELASDVQRAMLLRDALQEPDAAAKAAAPSHSLMRSSWLALAAGVLIGAVGLSIVPGPDNTLSVYSDVEYLTLDVYRSAQPQVASRIQRVSEQTLLIVEVPALPTTTKVEVIRPGGPSQLLTGTRDEGFLRIALPPPVATGDYVIVSGEVRYTFTVESGQP